MAKNAGILLSSPVNLKTLARKLASHGLIDLKNVYIEPQAKITMDGIYFCENDSYAYERYPIITEE